MKSFINKTKIRKLFAILALLISASALFAQQNSGLPGIEVVKTYTQEVLGRNVGFYVEIKNNSNLSFDALEYTVTYYDGFDEKVGEKEYKWQSGNIVKSIEPGKILKDYRANWIKGANKIKVRITRVHFIDGTIRKAGETIKI